MSVASRSGRAGLTLVELILAMAVLSIAGVGAVSVLIASSNLQQVTREKTLAYNASRDLVERMRSENFAELYARYNSDPKDDPAGEGTAPGSTFPVEGLIPAGANPVGRVEFPESSSGGGSMNLREFIVDPRLGMPRDLNRDGVVDNESHSLDYDILPVRIVLEWRGAMGTARLEINFLVTKK